MGGVKEGNASRSISLARFVPFVVKGLTVNCDARGFSKRGRIFICRDFSIRFFSL